MNVWALAMNSSCLRVIILRCISALPILLGVSLLTFFVVNVLPGNTAQQLAGLEATEAQVERLETALGLDRPLASRYLEWLRNLATGDLGQALSSNQPVRSLLAERMPVTVQLTGLAVTLALTLALPIAVLTARFPGSLADRLFATLSMGALAVPGYVLGPTLIMVFAVHLDLLPAIGFTPFSDSPTRNVASLTLPAITLAFPLLGFYSRFLRRELLEQLDDHDYTLTARSKGLGPWRVLIRHALPNSLLGLLTLIALHVSGLISGAVIVEQVFGLPGAGQLLLQAINLRDVIVIQAVVMFLVVLTIMANLLADILYAALDPRIRHDG